MRPRLLLASTFVLGLIGPASAWGPPAHRAVALIAEDRLDDRAKAGVAQLLAPDVGLDAVANCADSRIYGDIVCAGLFAMPKDPATMSWHFINVPVGAPGRAAPLETYCPRDPGGRYGNCVTEQIQRWFYVLADRGAPLDERRVALAYVVHLMGDLHQPFHVSDDGDRGGGTKKVTFDGLAVSLHSLWDSSISEDEIAEGKLRYRPGEDALAPAWMFREEFHGRGYARAMALEDLRAEGGTPPTEGLAQLLERVAWEAHGIAEQAYLAYYKAPAKDFGADYQARMRPVVRAQIREAGRNLAYLLNVALGKGLYGPSLWQPRSAEFSDRVGALQDPWGGRRP